MPVRLLPASRVRRSVAVADRSFIAAASRPFLVGWDDIERLDLDRIQPMPRVQRDSPDFLIFMQ